MDLSFQAIHDVVHATAAYSGAGTTVENGSDGSSKSSYKDNSKDGRKFGTGHGNDEGGQGPQLRDRCLAVDEANWEASQLNPKNRIDSLALLAEPLWRIDGSAGFGTQFYAYPLFLADTGRPLPPPMHIDVFIHEGASYPPVLRSLLDLDRAFHTKDAARVQRLGITRHLLRILQRLTVGPSADAGSASDPPLLPALVAHLYQSGPFGSRIVIENLSCHIHEARAVVSPNYPLENDLLSYRELLGIWGLGDQRGAAAEAAAPLPPEVGMAKIHMVRQLHDSISLVYMDEDDDCGDGDGSQKGGQRQLLILKSLTSGVKYMYHEIRALLKDIPPHPHVLARPLHIVTKPCLFGGKRGVIGFTMPYHEAGSLRDALPLLRIHGQLHLPDQTRWARQITDALCHVWHGGRGRFFYPDLRLDNVVLTAPAPAGDAGLVDFEQRGVWSGFAAPEVDYVENLRLLAFDDQDFDFAIHEAICSEYKEQLVACYEAAAAFEPAEAAPAAQPCASRSQPELVRLEEEVRYSNPARGYNVTWLCLTRREQEAAMVYMLGRLLWCLFEGVSAPHRGAVWQSYPREPEPGLEFPTFRRTPPVVQRVILRCLGDAGAGDCKFVCQTSKLYMKEEQHSTAASLHPKLVSADLQDRARRYWRTQLEEGTVWLRERHERLRRLREARQSHATGNKDESGGRLELPGAGSEYGRPTLRQVQAWLQDLDNGQLVLQ